jgi:hypothetical protein
VLPDASRFAGELGTVEFGVELWNGSTVIDIGATACTDSSCKPGGKPQVRDYKPVLAELADSAGASACLGNPPVFTRHYLRLTKTGGATHVRATAGTLSGGDACNFSVYLEP